MTRLTSGNSSVDRSSGAVIFHKSPELKELLAVKQEVMTLNEKLDEVLRILNGGVDNGGQEVEPRG